MASQEDTLVQRSRQLDILQSLVGRILRNYIKTRKEFKIFYKKGIGVLLEIILGNIKKERLKPKELVKSDK